MQPPNEPFPRVTDGCLRERRWRMESREFPVKGVIVDIDSEGIYRKGMRALALLREWRTVLDARLPGGTLEGLEKDLLVLQGRKGNEVEDRAANMATSVRCVESAVKRIQGAGLLYFRNQPGVANRFAALSLEED